jgi:hypothetical protein
MQGTEDKVVSLAGPGQWLSRRSCGLKRDVEKVLCEGKGHRIIETEWINVALECWDC